MIGSSQDCAGTNAGANESLRYHRNVDVLSSLINSLLMATRTYGSSVPPSDTATVTEDDVMRIVTNAEAAQMSTAHKSHIAMRLSLSISTYCCLFPMAAVKKPSMPCA